MRRAPSFLPGLLLILGACWSAEAAPDSKKDATKMTTSTYPTYFASPRRDSFVPAETRAKGVIGWAKDLGAEATGARLLTWDANVVVSGGAAFAVYSPAGERLWERPIELSSPIGLANGLAYFMRPGIGLDAVDAKGATVLDNAPFPGVPSPEFHVILFWPREKDFVAAIYYANPTYDEEDMAGAITDPQLLGRRAAYGKVIAGWGTTLSGLETLPPLYLPEQDRWIASQRKVTVIDPDKDAAHDFAIPLEESLNWSGDAEGTLAITGLHEQRKVLLAVDLAGKELWRWQDGAGSDAWVGAQPPARGPGGRVVALTDRRVLAVEKGNLLWSYDLLDEARRGGAVLRKDGTLVDKDGKPLALDVPTWVTVLGDGSLLFTAGNGLRRLDAAGKLVWSTRLPAPAVAPPVVDPGGTIYVVTAKQLIQIK